MSFWAPQTNKESKTLSKLMEDPTESAKILERRKDLKLIAELAKLHDKMRDAFADPIQAQAHQKNIVCLYTEMGVVAACDKLAEEYQVDAWWCYGSTNPFSH